MKYDRKAVLFGNFKHREVARSSTAARLNIHNEPSEKILENALLLAEHCLQPIRDEFGRYSPSSWYRSEKLERALTGPAFNVWAERHDLLRDQKAWEQYFARKSHPKGEAADIEIIGVPNDELFEWCSEHLVFDQLIREFAKPNDPASGWVHISYKLEGNRGEILRLG